MNDRATIPVEIMITITMDNAHFNVVACFFHHCHHIGLVTANNKKPAMSEPMVELTRVGRSIT